MKKKRVSRLFDLWVCILLCSLVVLEMSFHTGIKEGGSTEGWLTFTYGLDWGDIGPDNKIKNSTLLRLFQGFSFLFFSFLFFFDSFPSPFSFLFLGAFSFFFSINRFYVIVPFPPIPLSVPPFLLLPPF